MSRKNFMLSWVEHDNLLLLRVPYTPVHMILRSVLCFENWWNMKYDIGPSWFSSYLCSYIQTEQAGAYHRIIILLTPTDICYGDIRSLASYDYPNAKCVFTTRATTTPYPTTTTSPRQRFTDIFTTSYPSTAGKYVPRHSKYVNPKI